MTIRLAVTLACVAAGTASAGQFSDWNLLVRHNVSTSSHVDGSAMIGGDLSGTSVFSMHKVTHSGGAGLVVGGNISGNNKVNQGGNLIHGGTISGTLDMNGGGSVQQQAGIGAMVSNAFSQANSFSSFLRDLAPTGSLSVLDGTKGTLNAGSTVTLGSHQVAVYSLNQSTLGGLSELGLNFGTADFVVINVDASMTGGAASIGMNFLGGLNQNNSGRIVCNFFNTTDLSIGTNLSGMVLATQADMTLFGSGMYGSVVVNSLVSNAEIRLRTFEGDFDIAVVPLPPAVWAGLGMLGVGAGVRSARRR
jgi:choice-of-anchor A domain-containing protein